jgi:hypothetical protein
MRNWVSFKSRSERMHCTIKYTLQTAFFAVKLSLQPIKEVHEFRKKAMRSTFITELQ